MPLHKIRVEKISSLFLNIKIRCPLLLTITCWVSSSLRCIIPVYCLRVIFYVRKIGLYLNKYRIYGTITIYILKGLAPVYHLI